MREQVHAPWTPEQVESLNGFQQSPCFKPWLCANLGNDYKLNCRAVLVATEEGLICPVDCNHRQYGGFGIHPIGTVSAWAWDWMLNNSWRECKPGERFCGWCEHFHKDGGEPCEKCEPGKHCGQRHDTEPHLGWGIGCPQCLPWPG